MFGEIEFEKGSTAHFRRRAWEEWTDPSIVRALLRWKDKSKLHNEELTRYLIQQSGMFVGADVLDLASGLGEPALAIAAQVGPTGRVVATEISSEFIETIKKDAKNQSLANLTVVQAEACELPFPSESFDVVTSRLGAMYFVPFQQALSEIRRVLNPGGRVSLLTWGMPEQSTYYTTCLFPFLMRSNVDPPAPDAPTPLRFSPPGALTTELQAAGFKDIAEDRAILDLKWPGPPEEAWQHLYEVGTSLRFIFDTLSKEAFNESYLEALSMLRERWNGSVTTTKVEVVVGSGKR